jgi:hypothetical protein
VSKIVNHARHELNLIGEDPEVTEAIVKVVEAFSDLQERFLPSLICYHRIDKLLRMQNLAPLTDDPDEWIPVGGNDLHQSKRNPHAFSVDGGKSYRLLYSNETYKSKEK